MPDSQCSSPPLPAFEPDVEDSWSPVQSPIADPLGSYQGCGLSTPTFDTMVDSKYVEDTSTLFHSTYSTLIDWAGDGFPKQHSAIPGSNSGFPYVLAQPPMVYGSDSVGVIKDTFDTAANGILCGGWDTELSLSAFTSTADQVYSRWDIASEPQRLQYWSQNTIQDPRGRQDDLQLFSLPGIDTGRSGRSVRQA